MKDEELLLIAGLGLVLLQKPKEAITKETIMSSIPQQYMNPLPWTRQPKTIEEIPLPEGVKMEDIILATTYDRETGFYEMPTVEQVTQYLETYNPPIVEQPTIIEPIVEQPIMIEEPPLYTNGTSIIYKNPMGIVKEGIIVSYIGKYGEGWNNAYNITVEGYPTIINETDIIGTS